MGKGDKKTTKGKRAIGSYGKTRKRKESAPIVIVKKEKKNKNWRFAYDMYCRELLVNHRVVVQRTNNSESTQSRC